jgi:acetyltransferase-like isoleucine patch superfamily enzyme
MVRFTFLEFITPSPLNILFYRMMGMKIGKGVVINSSNISDPCLITLGDYVTVGGSATIFAHYGQRGYLVVAPVVIGKGTNIGLKASVMGGSVIGENVMIKPHTAVLPKTQIPDGETV